ncbi:MAG: tryptophanyl-tRNA synthetase [Parcubacteria group bacterium Gr01-1014_13]|nr:MAG: tryptophanyl-tRNA synthetase [Parcubacteria group bacterium Gr01-1014_13]
MKRAVSGVQPTNNLHLGNYLGAIKNWVELQDQYDSFYCIVDLHAITIKQDPKVLRQNVLNVAKTYLALGIDPNKSTIFVQSQVPQHAELAWVLNTIAKLGELERMTQFKDKASQHKENINMGLFDYPVLMSADILLYDPEIVPVGEDQKQHVELTRDLAERFNSAYSKTFLVPEPLIKKEGARIMGLDDPSKKMSKSATSANNYIALLDSPEVAAKKISKAVTDSGSTIESGKDKPALTNLLTIYSLLSGKTIKEIEKEYTGKGYADFKKGLTATVTEFLSDFQAKFNALDDNEVKSILEEGNKKARAIAEKKMVDVKTKMGLI